MKTMLAKRYRKARQRQTKLWHDHHGRQWRDLDETVPLEPAPQAGPWSVLIVAPRMEEQAAEALRDAGYLAWFPQTVEVVKSQGRRTHTKVNRPLFPRYVFAAAGEAVDRFSWPDRSTCRAIAVRASSGQFSEMILGKPERVGMLDCDHVIRIVAEVGQGLLDELSRRQAGGEFEVTAKVKAAFVKGAKVRLTDGPFAGFDGVVHKSARDRIEVLVRLFGRETSVRLEPQQVQAA